MSSTAAMPTFGTGSLRVRALSITTWRAAWSARFRSVGCGTRTVRVSWRMVPKLCRISPTILRLGTMTRERSAWTRVVAESSMCVTSPRTPTIAMCSPTRKGEAEAEAGHPDARDEGRHREAELVEGDHHGQDQHDDLDHAHEEDAHGRFHLGLLEALIGQAAQPAGDEETDHQDGERAQDLEAVARQDLHDQLLRVRAHVHDAS